MVDHARKGDAATVRLRDRVADCRGEVERLPRRLDRQTMSVSTPSREVKRRTASAER